MKIYEIDKEYINYLHSFDNKVENATAEHYKFSRKYLGIVLTIENFKYFAPLSSTKSHKDYFPDGKIRPSVVPLIRITKVNKDGSLSLLGKIQLNNMIPIIDDKLINIYDLNSEKDIKYKYMVLNQINFINKNKKLILKNANIIYKNKIKNLDIGYVKNSVDFKLLEGKALEYAHTKEKILEEKMDSFFPEVKFDNKMIKEIVKVILDEEKKIKPEKEKPKREKRSRIRSNSNER